VVSINFLKAILCLPIARFSHRLEPPMRGFRLFLCSIVAGWLFNARNDPNVDDKEKYRNKLGNERIFWCDLISNVVGGIFRTRLTNKAQRSILSDENVLHATRRLCTTATG
jgi:hypothetical protein